MSCLRPLLLSGAPRSGTTLIYTLFDSHPEILWLVSEGYLFEYLHDIRPHNAPLFVRAARGSPERLVEGLRNSQHLERVLLGAVTQSAEEGQNTVQFTVTGVLRGDAPLQARRRGSSRRTREGA